jgi:hypothetical protein
MHESSFRRSHLPSEATRRDKSLSQPVMSGTAA